MPITALLPFDLDGLDPDTDIWVEACVLCDRTDNHGNAFCSGCDD